MVLEGIVMSDSHLKNKLYDFKDRLRKGKMFTVVVTLIVIIIILTVYALKKSLDYRRIAENNYNQAFYELVEYTNNTEKLLAKSTISNSKEHAAKILTSAWKSASLAQTYISFLPIPTNDLEQVQKFFNQVSDYCFYLSKKSIDGENLSDDDISKLTSLHEYSVSLVNTINQLEGDLSDSTIKWGELTNKGKTAFNNEDSNLSKVTFSNIEEDLHQYTGLIYDGAFSENQSIFNGKGLTGDEVDINIAREKSIDFIGKDKVSELSNGEEVTTANIECFKFDVTLKSTVKGEIILSKKGAHIISYNVERDVLEKNIDDNSAVNLGKSFLNTHEYRSMKETYYMENRNILTVNYAYFSDNVICYPDLVKVKIALDNGEILGVEARNYLNNHDENRDFDKYSISVSDALNKVNKNLEIKSCDKAIIPTEWNSEIACYEIKGNAYGNDFIVFINGESGKEEDILMIINTEEGTLTM